MTEQGASVVVVVLAAGRSSRMGKEGPHKLLALFNDIPLARRSVAAALACDQQKVVVVTGHRHDEIVKAIDGLPCEIIRNEDYSTGIASSVRCGVVSALRTSPDGIMIALADMPNLSTDHLDALVAAFRRSGGSSVVRAVGNGWPGNPVIFPRRLYGDLQELKGDTGARELIRCSGVRIVDVEIGVAALLDVDTVEQVLAAGGSLQHPGQPAACEWAAARIHDSLSWRHDDCTG